MRQCHLLVIKGKLTGERQVRSSGLSLYQEQLTRIGIRAYK